MVRVPLRFQTAATPDERLDSEESRKKQTGFAIEFSGTYSVSTIRQIFSPDSVKVIAGSDHEQTFTLREVKLHILVKDQDGKPMTNRRYEKRYKVKGSWIHEGGNPTTDDKGFVTMERAPQHPFYLVFFPKGKNAKRASLEVGPLTPPLDRYEDFLEVHIPAAKKR